MPNVPIFGQPIDDNSVSLRKPYNNGYGNAGNGTDWAHTYLNMLNGGGDGSFSPGTVQDRFAQHQNAKAATGGFANEARMRQQALLDELQGIASGRQKSPAELELEKQVQAASSAGTSSLLGARDVGGGEMRRQIDAEQSNVQRQGYTDQNVLHAQAQQQAQQALAQFYAQQRGQDLSQADLNAQGILGQRGVDDQNTTAMLQGGVNAAMGATQNAQNVALAKMGFDLDQQKLNQAFGQMAIGGVGTTFDYLRQQGKGK